MGRNSYSRAARAPSTLRLKARSRGLPGGPCLTFRTRPATLAVPLHLRVPSATGSCMRAQELCGPSLPRLPSRSMAKGKKSTTIIRLIHGGDRLLLHEEKEGQGECRKADVDEARPCCQQ